MTPVYDYIETPVVGQHYIVNCAVLNMKGKILKVPIVGKMHNDPQFGAVNDHLHIDGRFSNSKIARMFNLGSNGNSYDVIWSNDVSFSRPYSIVGYEPKKLKCQRLTTGVIKDDRILSTKYVGWYKSMVGKSCKGRRCPHYGTHMNEVDGKLVCPLHNLTGDVNTETIVDLFPEDKILQRISDNFNQFLKQKN